MLGKKKLHNHVHATLDGIENDCMNTIMVTDVMDNGDRCNGELKNIKEH